jgi:hypothetical protein
MSQGYAGYNIMDTAVSIKDSANLDAFSRLRVSNPLILHNSQFTYDLAPLIMEQITNGSGATVTYDSTNRCALMTFSSTPTGGKSYMQSYEYLPYQPGRSQLVFVTFNMVAAVANVLKFAGYSDGVNGIEFQLNGTTKQFTVYSGSSAGNETVVQSSWNLDKLDGTGASGITLDITKTQILVIDIQALYVGRVRIGFDIGGKIVYAHEFKHSNLVAYPYLQTANLPVRCGMTCTATVSTTMNFICSAVISEGGSEDINVYGYTFSTAASRTLPSAGSSVQLITLRPKLTFNGITNRSRVAFIDVEIYLDGNGSLKWELLIGQAITGGTWTDVNTNYSSSESNPANNATATATLSGSPLVVIDAGWVSSSAQTQSVTNTSVISRYPITLDAAGLQRVNGTLTLKVTTVSIVSSPTVYGAIKFREIR